MFRKKRSLLLVSITVAFCLMIVDLSASRWQLFESFGEQFEDDQKTDAAEQARRSSKAVSEQELVFPGRNLKEVSLSSEGGHISVRRSADSDVHAQYTVTAFGRDSSKADRKLAAVKVEGNAAGDQLTLAASDNGKSIDERYVTIDYAIAVPDGMKLTIENENGAVRIGGIAGDVTVKSESGITDVVDIVGDVAADISYGSLYLSGITGNIDIVNQSSSTNTEAVKGNIAIANHYGRNFVTDIEGKVTGTTEGGPLYLSDVSGSVELDGEDSVLQLDRIRGNIRIDFRSGQTKLILPEAEGYDLNVIAKGGTIRSQLPFSIQESRSGDHETRLGGIIGSGKWKVDVTADPGVISIHSH